MKILNGYTSTYNLTTSGKMTLDSLSTDKTGDESRYVYCNNDKLLTLYGKWRVSEDKLINHKEGIEKILNEEEIMN